MLRGFTIRRVLYLLAISAFLTAFVVMTPLYIVVLIIAIRVFRMPIAIQTGVGFDDGGYSDFMLSIGLPLMIFAVAMGCGLILLVATAGKRAPTSGKKSLPDSDLD